MINVIVDFQVCDPYPDGDFIPFTVSNLGWPAG